MNAEIIRAIWDKSERPGHPYLGWIKRPEGQFSDAAFSAHPQAIWPEEKPGHDLFFTPRLFVGSRLNDAATPCALLYADLDNWLNSKDQLRRIWPHALWMTSPGNAQAVWFLSAPIADTAQWSDLNQRMTYFMGADKGGWHASKLLRVPETINWKYEAPQMGTVISDLTAAKPYEAEALRAQLPVLKVGSDHSLSTHPPIKEEDEWKPYLATLWSRMPLGTKSDLLQPTMKDRSRKIIATVNKMRAYDFTSEEIFQCLWWVEWNKFRTDRHDPAYLWKVINYR